MARLLNEWEVYRTIEDARLSGVQVSVVPRCYGLYETAVTVALVLEYVGESLPGLEWDCLEEHEK